MTGQLQASVIQNLTNLRLGMNKLRHIRNLVFIPIRIVRGVPEHPVSCIPLATAVESGAVTVKETCTVQSLSVTNLSSQLVLGVPGTYLRGGGQDRALPMSVLVSAYASGDLPVRCVEHSRWQPSTGQKFATGESLTCSQVFTGTNEIGQGQVWNSVANISRSTHTMSETMCHGDTIEQLRGSVGDYTKPMTLAPLPDRTVGGLFLAYLGNGRMHCALDIFGREDLFQFYFPKLCESVALTALAGRPNDDSRDYQEGTSLEWICAAIFHNLSVAKLSEENVPLNAGQLLAKIGGKSGCRVSCLQYQGGTLHSMMRWDALCV
ncbi:MAG TPA: DUF6569 family protein [Candidatus Andersenbacteria bacterium]|nr:DUF6569 family protein [Candidatus Andersenbacteria bacterium]